MWLMGIVDSSGSHFLKKGLPEQVGEKKCVHFCVLKQQKININNN